MLLALHRGASSSGWCVLVVRFLWQLWETSLWQGQSTTYNDHMTTGFHQSSDFSFLNLWLPAYDFPLFLDYKLPEGNASIPFICIHSFLVQRKRSGFYSRFLWELSYSIGQWDLHWCFLAQGLSQRPQRRQQFLTVFIKQMWSVCSILGLSIQIEQERHYLCLLRAYSSAKKQKT